MEIWQGFGCTGQQSETYLGDWKRGYSLVRRITRSEQSGHARTFPRPPLLPLGNRLYLAGSIDTAQKPTQMARQRNENDAQNFKRQSVVRQKHASPPSTEMHPPH